MESCHSVLPSIIKSTPHPPTSGRRLSPKLYSTLSQLINVLEQLSSSKDSSVSVVTDAGDPPSPPEGSGSQGQDTSTSGASYIDLDPGTIIKIAQILRTFNSKDCSTMQSSETHGTSFASTDRLTSVSNETPGKVKVGGEQRRTSDGRHLTLSKQDSLYLMKKIRDFEQKCKPLQEKNKKFLEKNMELTTQNKSLKEQIRTIADDNRKLKEGYEQFRKKCSVLSRQLSVEKVERERLEKKDHDVQTLKSDLAQRDNTITAMKQQSAEKDRRMEVLQHRKKRRLRMSEEYISRLSSPCSVEDELSQDSDLSMSSVSDEDLVEEVDEKAERVEKNYRRLMKEQLILQKSHSKLQAILGWGTDTQRYIKTKLDFEMDLYVAQCKIEQLEESLEKYKDMDLGWLREKEDLDNQIRDQAAHILSQTQLVESQLATIEELRGELRETTQSYEDLKEQSEHLEFLILETQEGHKAEGLRNDASTLTDPWSHPDDQECEGFAVEEEIYAVTSGQLEMAESDQYCLTDRMAKDQWKARMQGLEEKLRTLLQGQPCEMKTMMLQLQYTDQDELDVVEAETTMRELQEKVTSLQQENTHLTEQVTSLSDKMTSLQREKMSLTDTLTRCRERLDSQEQSLSLTRDEREELLQVKLPTSEGVLDHRLRLAELGQSRSEQLTNALRSGHQGNTITPSHPAPGNKPGDHMLSGGRDSTESDDECSDLESDGRMYRRFRINSLPVLHGDGQREMYREVDKLQRQITALQEENDVLKFELSQHSDSEAGSDTEDGRLMELRDTCDKLRERLQAAETTERHCRDRLKLTEQHITELELNETVLRDRVEESNNDCDKLRKQIVRLQRKIRELKDTVGDREASEVCLSEKLKFLEESEAGLSQKAAELESTNQMLRQRLDVKEELLGNVHLVEGLQEKVSCLQTENTGLQARVLDLEDSNEALRENWRKVADEHADRRQCLEEKIRVLECANTALKSRLSDSETDLSLSLGPSIASEIHDDTVSKLNTRVADLERELSSLKQESASYVNTIESMKQSIENMKKTELTFNETVLELENNKETLKNRIRDLEKCEQTKRDVTEDSLDGATDCGVIGELKDKIAELEKSHEKQCMLYEREVAELQQQEDDLCTRIEELEQTEALLTSKLSKGAETEMNCRNKIEELENRETSLTIRFSQRVQHLEQSERDLTEKYEQNLKQLEHLQEENKSLTHRVSVLEKYEQEISEKCLSNNSYSEQENVELLQGENNAGPPTITLHEKFESVAKVESQLNVHEHNQCDESLESVKIDKDNLASELMKLREALSESDKERKSLEDKLKRQEKKRKRSERAENTDNYDTIAREVVTYKMEVDQLRTENSELHDRIMDLDESEKALKERNEQLVSDIDALRRCKGDHDLSNLREQQLVSRISDLESTEQSLREQIDQYSCSSNREVRSFDCAGDSVGSVECGGVKVVEMVDQSVGTGDFMEGVMSSQDQGKPVSSMFERIQVLETENQELSGRLGVMTATEGQVRQLTDKVRGLEETEDELMERVVELEEETDTLRRELTRVRTASANLPDLEAQLSDLNSTNSTLNNSLKTITMEHDSLKKIMETSDSEKGGIAIRLASVQKLYEDEKKKVESLLKGEEKWMKSVASEKKAAKEMEEELAATQEKLEELQTEYENKLSLKDDSEKLLKEEINKILREKQMLKKKLQEYEQSNSELEDEIEHCKISESRMFHKLQQLNTQNEELELKLSKLMKVLPNSDSLDGATVESHLMAENPEVVPENPLNNSIFTETELNLLRSKTPDYDLLGSVPLDMLRKMKDFDQREQNYQTKIQEIEVKNVKLLRNVKLLQSKEKDLKHEIKELQLEALKCGSQLSVNHRHASSSSVDVNESGSEDGRDGELSSQDEAFQPEGERQAERGGQYEHMSHEELLLSVKLLEAQGLQETQRVQELEAQLAAVRHMLACLDDSLTADTLDTYTSAVTDLVQHLNSQEQLSGWSEVVTSVVGHVTTLWHRLETLHSNEQQLRLSLAESEISTDRLVEESRVRVEQLEAQIHVLAQLSSRYSSSTRTDASVQASLPELRRQLEASKTINIDVSPSVTRRISESRLGQSETIRVNVPPPHVDSEDSSCTDTGYHGDGTMMERAEDVLRQRIRELEKLETHLKQQVLDLEYDREELHEIARKDKALIHEQNVLIRELQLSQRNFLSQVAQFESSEAALYARLDSLEADLDMGQDRIRELEILEQRLKDLVTQYKLDEKILVTKSTTLETSVKEMSEKEETLKQKVQNLETEKSAFSERSEYLQMRLKELENAEIDLSERAKNQENFLQTLQNTVIELETFGANAHARVVELEHINFDLQQRLHHSMTENSPMTKKVGELQQRCEAMSSELATLRDTEIKMARENEALEKNEASLQGQVKSLRLAAVDLEGKLRDLEAADGILKDKVSKLQRSENTLKYRLQELEASGIQAPSDLTGSSSHSVKLPRTLEECQRRIIVLQANNAELQSRLNPNVSGTLPRDQQGNVFISQGDFEKLERQVKVAQQTESQLQEADRLNAHLQNTITQLRDGKDICGHEVEIEVLQKRLDEANMSIKKLQNHSSGQWVTQGSNGWTRSAGGPQREADVEEALIKESASVQQHTAPGLRLSRDAMLDDLLASVGPAPGHRGEDAQWREIESRMETVGGNNQWISVGNTSGCYADRPHWSHGNEELEVALALNSETDLQNDTDSGHYGNKLSQRQQRHHSDLTWTPTLPKDSPERGGRTTDGFDESLTLHHAHDYLSDHNKQLMYRKGHSVAMSAPSLVDSVADSGRATASVSIATSSKTLRDKIAHIEKQLSGRESDSAREFTSELDLTSWKARVQETNRKLELAERDNKHSKEEINRLERELEEKTRLYQHLETFLQAVRIILQYKDSHGDSETVNKVEIEVGKVVSNLAGSTVQPDNISHDTATVSSELAKKDRELIAKRNEVDSLVQELRQWQQECRTIEEMRATALDSLRDLEHEISHLQHSDTQLKLVKDNYNTLRGQTVERDGTTVTMATHRTKVVQLSTLCKEKDVLIRKLVQELRKLKCGGGTSSLVEELCRLEPDQNTLQRSSSQSSLDSVDRMSIVSDTELLRDSSPSLARRPRSADMNHQRNLPHRASYHGHSNVPRHAGHRANNRRHGGQSHSPHIPSSRSAGWRSDQVYRTTQYVAVTDYDPALASRSGHPRLELPLQEGDSVLVTGPLHESGYVEGEVRGRVGLVPLSYLQPASPRRHTGNQRRVPDHLNASPERIAQLYQSLHSVHTPNTHSFSNRVSNGSNTLPGSLQVVPMTTGPPDAPEDFHVEKITGTSSLMLVWQPVGVDTHGCNNGGKVSGYKIYRNSRLLVQPRGRHAAKAIIENINIQSEHRFGIATVCSDGRVSELSEIVYEGVEEMSSGENSDTESEMDMATTSLNMHVYTSAQKRMFMGVYDYDPSQNSPYEHPNSELAFRAGDIITVYGRQRGDGFYHAEINGVRGLVPTFFIEEMPQPPPRTKKIASRNRQSNKEKQNQ